MENETCNNTGLDWNSVITKLILAHEQAFFKALSSAAKDRYSKAQVNFGGAFKTYLTRAMDKYSKVKTLLYRNSPRYLYEFYEFNDIEAEDHEIIECDHISAVLDYSKFSIVIGDGGSGKTMLMRHFFINALQESDFIPIFVELRNIDETTSVFDYVYKCLSVLGFELEKDFFEYALKQGMFLILLDGYDEIKSAAKETFFFRLEEFCDMYCENNFIMSSRKNGSFIGWQRFTIYQIKPLTKRRALDLIDKLDYDTEIREKFHIQLDKELFNKYESFASNPLLLTIMLMTFDQYAEIPEKLHVFYACAFDAMYSMHDATKGGYKRELKSGLTSDQFKDVFSRFCFRTYIKGLFQFSRTDILHHIGEAGSSISDFDASAYFEDLQVAVCLLCEEGLDYQFTHRSFQEYFTAYYLNMLDDEKQKKACRYLLKASGANLDADKALDMLRDMGEDRFEKNYIVPVLEEIKEGCPVFPDLVQQYFFGLIECCYISTDIGKIFTELKFNWIYPLSGDIYSFEKGTAFIGVKFCNDEFGMFVNCVSRYYGDTIEKSSKNKLDIKYWEQYHTPEDIWKDPTLKQHFLQYTTLGKEIKLISSLGDFIEKRQSKADDEFLKMFNDIKDY